MVPASLVVLIGAGPAILGASSSGDNEPEAFRAWGAYVHDDGRLRVLVSSDAVRTHENLQSNGRIAVTFTDILTFRSVQVKGTVDSVDPPDRADVDAMRDYHERFCANLLAVGHPRALPDHLRPMSVVGVWIEVEDVFDQTPGRFAGARMSEGDRMSGALDLTAMRGCFDGVIPPVIATCDGSGRPNVTHVSQVHVVDDRHVAVSNQFFSKTSANLAANPRASVLVTDSQTYETFRLELRFIRTETAGPLFDDLRARVDAIAALVGMEDVFALRGADVYEVERSTRL